MNSKCVSRRIALGNHQLTFVLLLLIGLGLRLAFLFQPMCHDETVNYLYFAIPPLKYGLSTYPYPNNHLFNTFFIHFTTKIFGNSPWAIRLPAFSAGLLLIPLTYFVFKALYNEKVALLSMALVVPFSQLIEYSTNARGFTIQTSIVLASIIIGFQLMKKPKKFYWIWLTILFALGFYTIPTMLYFFVGIVLWMVISLIFGEVGEKKSAFILKLTILCICTICFVVLLYSPIIIKSGLSSITSNPWVKALTWEEFFRSIPSSLHEYWKSWTAGLPLPISVVIVLCLIFSTILHKRTGKSRVNLLYPVIGSCILIVIAQRRCPPSRVWLPILPLFLGFSAVGLCFLYDEIMKKLDKRKHLLSFDLFPILCLLIAVFLGICTVWSQSPYQPPDQVTFRDAEKVTKFFGENLRSGDIIYIEPNVRKPLEYYFYINKIPSSYIYKYPEDKGKKYTGIKRAFVIDVGRERKIYGLDTALRFSNLSRGHTFYYKMVANFSKSSIFEILNPVLQ